MKLHITYQELSELVKSKADKIVEYSYIDSKTVNTKYTYMQKVPFCNKYISVPINVKVRVEGFENGNLLLSYDAGIGLDTIISGILSLYPGLKDMNIFEIQEKQKAVVFLTKIDQVRDTLEKIDILDICFDTDGVNITFSLHGECVPMKI